MDLLQLVPSLIVCSLSNDLTITAHSSRRSHHNCLRGDLLLQHAAYTIPCEVLDRGRTYCSNAAHDDRFTWCDSCRGCERGEVSMALGKNGVAGAPDHFLLGSLVSAIGTSICMPPLSSPGDSTSLTRNTELFLVLAHHHHGNGLSSSDCSAVHCTAICALIHSGARDISHFRQNQSPRSYHGGWLRRGYSRLHYAACRKAELNSIRWNVSRGCWRVSLISNLDGKSLVFGNYSIY